MPMTNHTWQQTLEKAAAVWSTSRAAYRDARLEVGGLLREYLAARLAEADAMGEGKRTLSRCSRSCATEDAAVALKTNRPAVNNLIRVSAAVELLSDGGDVGALSYAAVNCFQALICRPHGRLDRSSKRTGLTPSAKERWEVKEPAEQSVGLFRKAVAEGWDETKCRQELAKRGFRSRSRGRGSRNDETDPAAGREQVRAALANGSPRDAAEYLYSLLRETADAAAVAEHLLRLARRAPRPSLA